MGVFTSQGYSGKLVAGSEQTILDTFRDEDIKVSNNVLDLFDLGEIPGTYTQTLTLPGTKKNNAFFEHYYDISVYTPDVFNTNQIVPAYLDFDSFYLVNGYLQLQKVNVIENKFVDSYEVTLFGIISNFSVDTRSSFLTDLSNLSIYNHTSSLANVAMSWANLLFDGDIVYPMAEYGQRMAYAQGVAGFGIDERSGSLSVQDYKPAIRLKKVWDAIFSQFGYTYTGSFWNEPFLDKVYLLCNNGLRAPVYPISIETFGQGRVTNVSGSSRQTLSNNVTQDFLFSAKTFDYDNKFTITGGQTEYATDITTYLNCTIDLAFQVSKSNATLGSGVPKFSLYFQNQNTGTVTTASLTLINDYLENNILNNVTTTQTQIFSDFRNVPVRIPEIDSGSQLIRIGYTAVGADNFQVHLNPDGNNLCALEVKRVNQVADGQIMDIPSNMPAGNSGIRVIDFIKAVQKKFNLVLYQDKRVPNQFICETFNDWYRSGRVVDFNQYINLAEKISFTPANSLAYRQIKFQDAEDTDYVTTIFKRTNNRTYGESNFYDSASYFSQGKLDVNSEAIASATLVQIDGSVYSGSAAAGTCTQYYVQNAGSNTAIFFYNDCYNTGVSVPYFLPPGQNVTICIRSGTTITVTQGTISSTNTGTCSTYVDTGVQFPVWVPSFISDANYTPAKVLPRIMFYNGHVSASAYWLSGYTLPNITSIDDVQFTSYPYFDNYSSGSTLNGSQSVFPTENARSLLYNNEIAVVGSTPTQNLVSEYWDQYIKLLYNPRTRLVECSAVIPIGDYINLELNDIVEFRGSYYHLRAINNYNLKTGQCDLQLLGPVLADTISNVLSGSWAPPSDPCEFTYTASLVGACTSFTATKLSTFQSVSSIYWTGCNDVVQSASLYENPFNPGEFSTITFCAQSGSLTYDNAQISVINNGPCVLQKVWEQKNSIWEFGDQLWENA